MVDWSASPLRLIHPNSMHDDSSPDVDTVRRIEDARVSLLRYEKAIPTYTSFVIRACRRQRTLVRAARVRTQQGYRHAGSMSQRTLVRAARAWTRQGYRHVGSIRPCTLVREERTTRLRTSRRSTRQLRQLRLCETSCLFPPDG